MSQFSVLFVALRSVTNRNTARTQTSTFSHVHTHNTMRLSRLPRASNRPSSPLLAPSTVTPSSSSPSVLVFLESCAFLACAPERCEWSRSQFAIRFQETNRTNPNMDSLYQNPQIIHRRMPNLQCMQHSTDDNTHGNLSIHPFVFKYIG